MRLGSTPRRSPAHRPPARRPLARLSAVAAAAVLVVAGCVPQEGQGPGETPSTGQSDNGGAGSGDGTTDGTSGDGQELATLGTSAAKDLPTDPAEDPAYAAYYEQDITWGPCDDVEGGSELECGTLTVPMVWNDPDAGDIELAVARHAASGDRTGSLILNPGGPGGSGVDFTASAPFLFSRPVVDAYDIIGFDPRGVARSAGIQCLSDEETDEYLAGTGDMGTEDPLEEGLAWMKRIAEGCQQDSGELLPYLDTYSAARDMDVLRAAVDSEQLDYFGYSYGTYLGATYADLYPERVGKFVLDAALDPSSTLDEISAGQAEGFELATDAFLEDCLTRGDSCPFKGEPAEAKQQLQNFFDSVEAQPLETSDPQRPLTVSLAQSAVLLLMYEDGLWQVGRDALAQGMQGDGSALLQIADLSSERQPDGSYKGNGMFAINAINCLDHPGIADQDWQAKEAERLAAEYPTFGPSMGYGATMCAQWPVPPLREPAPISAEGAGPIVVIGTTGDPATPYRWSQSLAEQLDDAVLLTFEGNGHTAYGRSGGCIEEAVDAYLLEGTTPQDGLTCSSGG